MNSKALNSLADLVCRAQEQDRTPMGIAFAIDSAGRHMSPETAAELEQLRRSVESNRVDGRRLIRAEQRTAELEAVLGTHRKDDQAQIDRLRARVAELEARAPEGEQSAGAYPPALPWAQLMDHEDLAEFLDELGASAITHASSEVALVEVEETCSRWRLIAEAQHGHNTAPGPDGVPQTLSEAGDPS